MLQMLHEALLAVTRFIEALGYWGIGLGMAVESANIPLPSEVILPYGGFLVSKGKLDFFWTVMAGTIGGTAGSIVSYLLGLWGGRPLLLRYGRYIGFSYHHLGIAERWFARYGEATVFFTRLMPVVRTFISLPAGVAGMNFTRFVIYTFLGSLPWSIVLVYAGVKLGENWEAIGPWFHRLDVVIVLALAAVLFYWWRRRRRNR
ncbi:MAG: DedA family protein [Thermoanaerobacterales bacterium]|nr:DedA family protein [Bacillota bacterium]MDI6907530.1 DedA family protein [Thermoanaerobacterales bacterium]